jgi:spore coat polysaccharide biosynthesis protein SpsF
MIGIIIQARTQSTRFPRKIYEDINGKYTLQRVLEGATRASVPNKIILAMPEYDKSEVEERAARGEFIKFTDERFCTYFGSADDLVDRYFMAARENSIDTVVRITADCPFSQGNIIDDMLIEYFKNGYRGYMSNRPTANNKFPFPDGIDVEIFSWWLLAETHMLAKDPLHREHCCPYMYRPGTQYSVYTFENCEPRKTISTRFPDFSFDTPEDLVLIKKIADNYDKHADLNRAILEVQL